MDRFQNYQAAPIGCPRVHFAITPSDTDDLPETVQILYCTVSGAVAMRDAAGTVITYNLSAGQMLFFRATRVLATGTTATLVGWV